MWAFLVGFEKAGGLLIDLSDSQPLRSYILYTDTFRPSTIVSLDYIRNGRFVFTPVWAMLPFDSTPMGSYKLAVLPDKYYLSITVLVLFRLFTFSQQ